MLTVEQFARCTGASLTRATTHHARYLEAMAVYSIVSPQRVAMLLANVGHESGGFAFSSEVWGPSAAQKRYERDPLAPWPSTASEALQPAFLRNCLAWRLGNLNAGDGYKYRGRGDIDNTGHGNYTRLTVRLRKRFASRADIPDFEADPEALTQPEWAALAACDYVDMIGANAQADAGNFDHYCDLVNLGRITKAVGDANGYARRALLLQAGYAALEIR